MKTRTPNSPWSSWQQKEEQQQGKNQGQMPGYQDYERRLQEIKPNNQYDYQPNNNQQIYRNHPEFRNYPHMTAATQNEASNEINQYIGANNLQGQYAHANALQQQGQVGGLTAQQQAMLKIKQGQIAQLQQQHTSYQQQAAAQKAWEQQQAHNAWLTQQQAQQQPKTKALAQKPISPEAAQALYDLNILRQTLNGPLMPKDNQVEADRHRNILQKAEKYGYFW